MSAIQIQNVCKSFDEVKAVKDLSLSIDSGQVFGLLGSNGAGKTTTIRMMMGIIMPDSGSISLFGESRMDKMQHRIGYLPEERGLYRKMKVGEVLKFFGELKGLKGQVLQGRIDQWLERLDIPEWKEKKMEELSRGMQQKVQFISTILHDPDLVVLDEPFSGLDPVNANVLKDIILELKKAGKTLLFSTHIMENAEKLCDKICIVNKGQMVVEGEIHDVRAKFGKNTVFLKYYDGSPEFINKLDYVESMNDYGKHAEIQLKKDADSQALLKESLKHLRIQHFEMREPSLNQIFIEVVKNTEEGK